MFCTECGNRMADDARFCDHCGTPVAPEMPQPPNTVPTEDNGLFRATPISDTATRSKPFPTPAPLSQPTSASQSPASPYENNVDPYGETVGKYDKPSADHFVSAEPVRPEMPYVPTEPCKQSVHPQTAQHPPSAAPIPQQNIHGNYGQKKSVFSSLAAKIIAGAVVLIMLLTAVFIATRHTYKDPLYLTFEASLSGNLGDIMKLIPDDVNKAMDEQLSDSDLDNLERTLESYYSWKGEQLTETFGNNTKIRIKVQDKVKLSDQELEDENARIESRFGNAYNKADTKAVKNLREIHASKGYDLTIQARIKGDKHEETKEYRVRVLQIDDKWYTTDFYYIVPAYMLT